MKYVFTLVVVLWLGIIALLFMAAFSKPAAIQSAPNWAKDGKHGGLRYECVMTTTRGAYRFNYWGSIADCQAHRKPTQKAYERILKIGGELENMEIVGRTK